MLGTSTIGGVTAFGICYGFFSGGGELFSCACALLLDANYFQLYPLSHLRLQVLSLTAIILISGEFSCYQEFVL